MNSRFKKQFTADQWNRLIQDEAFNRAYKAGDIDNAGLISDKILYYGEAKTLSEARRKRKIVKALEDFGKEG